METAQPSIALKAVGVLFVEAAIAALASLGAVQVWICLAVGLVILVLAYWRQVRTIAGAIRYRLTGKPSERPSMTLLESLDAHMPARDALLHGVTSVNRAMMAWGKKSDEIKAKARDDTGKDAANRYWRAQAEAMDQYAADFEAACDLLAQGTSKLQEVVAARTYWHDRRKTADDLLSHESKEVFGLMRQVACANQANLRDNQEKLDASVMGWHQDMDIAALRWRKAVDQLIEHLAAVEVLSRDVLSFRLQRTGLFGSLRSIARRLSAKR